MNHRTVVILCTLGCLATIPFLDGCEEPKTVIIKNGTYRLVTNITVQDEWLQIGDKNVNGRIKYNVKNPSYSTIHLSQMSDDIHRTAIHELCHACHNATGADVKVIDQ